MIKEGLTLDTNNKSFADVYLCQNEDGSIGLNNQAFQEANKHAGVLYLYLTVSPMVNRLTTVTETDVL